MEEKCFRIFTGLKNWTDSEQACIEEGGHLAATTDYNTYYAVSSLVVLAGDTCKWARSVGKVYESYTAWIGLNHFNNPVRGVRTKVGWEWTNGAPYNDNNGWFNDRWFQLIGNRWFRRGFLQPNDVFRQPCGHIMRHDNVSQGWGDNVCSEKLCHICQAPATQGIYVQCAFIFF